MHLLDQFSRSSEVEHSSPLRMRTFEEDTKRLIAEVQDISVRHFPEHYLVWLTLKF